MNYYKGMGKHWENDPDLLGLVIRQNEVSWFKKHQGLLLKIANTDHGRDLLFIPKEYGHIIGISKSHVTSLEDYQKERAIKQTGFHVGAKRGNIIRHRWKEFCEYASFFEPNKWKVGERIWGPNILFPEIHRIPALATTSTFFPDPNPETDTWDGWAGRTNNDETWASIYGGAGDSSADVNVSDSTTNIGSSGTTNQWANTRRHINGFKTDPIDTDDISAATFSVEAIGSTIDDFTSDMVMDALDDPNSATAATDSDYDVASWDSVAQSDDRPTIASIGTGSYTVFTLNATGRGNINKTGISWFGMRIGEDFDNNEPTWQDTKFSQVDWRMAETAGTSSDPLLTVTHSAAAGAANHWLLTGV